MNLSACKTVVSVIVNVNDPNKEGAVQCNIPGHLDDAAVPKNIMPWVKPLMMGRTQSFTKPQVGDKALVLINDGNDKEYWYVLLNEPHQLLKTYLNAKYDKNPEVLFCQDHGDKQILFTYDDEDGFVMRIGDNILALRPDGKVDMSSGQSVGVGISGDKIQLGSSGSTGPGASGGSSSGGGGSSSGGGGGQSKHFVPAVLSDKLGEKLKKLQTGFDKLAIAAEASPYTAKLIDAIKECSAALNDIEEINSDTVQISKNIDFSKSPYFVGNMVKPATAGASTPSASPSSQYLYMNGGTNTGISG